MADKLSDKWQRICDALIEDARALGSPQPTPGHDYDSCQHVGCQRCEDYTTGYADAIIETQEWELGEHETDCDCPPCETVRKVLRSFVGMLRSEHGPQDTGRR